MSKSYIKLYRKSLNNDLFKEKPFDRWHAFEYLLLRAQRFPTNVSLNGKTVHLETGQLIESEVTLANTWGWSRGKVRRFLAMLERTGIATSNGTANGTTITLENYGFYQVGRSADGTANGTANGTHNKKVKESNTASATSKDVRGGKQKKPYVRPPVEKW